MTLKNATLHNNLWKRNEFGPGQTHAHPQTSAQMGIKFRETFPQKAQQSLSM